MARGRGTAWQAYRLYDPPLAFVTAKHPGALGKGFSLLRVNNEHVQVMAVKKAEESDEVIVRVVEMRGQAAPNLRVTFAAPIVAAREVNGQEEPVGEAAVAEGTVATALAPYEIRSFVVKLGTAAASLTPASFAPVTLQYNLATASEDGAKAASGFDSAGEALPAEMLPTQLDYNGIQFQLGPAWTGKPNAVAARAQSIDLPRNNFKWGISPGSRRGWRSKGRISCRRPRR